MHKWLGRMLLVSLVLLSWGLLRSAQKSQLFVVSEVEWKLGEGALPVSREELQRVLPLLVGKTSLFEISLDHYKTLLMQNPWIREARLEKQFPSTLKVEIEFRKPIAWISQDSDRLAILDEKGQVFQEQSDSQRPPASALDLPHVSEWEGDFSDAVPNLQAWEGMFEGTGVLLAELSYSLEKGLRGLAVYPLHVQEGRVAWNRAQLRWETSFDSSLPALKTVLSQLSQRSVAVDRIWVMSDKKMVVRAKVGS